MVTINEGDNLFMLKQETIIALKVAAEKISKSYTELIASVNRIAEGITGDNQRISEAVDKLGVEIS